MNNGARWNDRAVEFALKLFPLLPVAVAIVAFRRGSSLALVTIAIFALQLAWWLIYNFTDWISNPGMAGVWRVIILPSIAGLAIAIVALLCTQSARTQSKRW